MARARLNFFKSLAAAATGVWVFPSPVHAQTPVTAFVDVAVVPMDSDRVLTRQTVVVQGSRIVAMGPANQVTIPSTATRVDGHGQFLLPGLADMHVHLDDPTLTLGGEQYPATREDLLVLYLLNGVTTIRDMGGSHPPIELRGQIARGEVLGPRIYTARDQVEHTMLTPEDAKRIVAEHKAGGYDFIKLHGDPPSREVFDTFVAAAKRAGIPFAGHTPKAVGLAGMLGAGAASIEHLWGYVAAVIDSARLPSTDSLARLDEAAARAARFAAIDTTKIRLMAEATRRAGVWNCPTEAVSSPLAAAFESPEIVSLRHKLIKALQDAGAGLLLGTDGPGYLSDQVPPGSQVHAELTSLVAAGLTPYQALMTGTRNVAAFLGALDSTGTVAVGKRADLVLVRSNPLEDVRHAAHPVGVMLGGHWLPRTELAARLTAAGVPKAWLEE